MSEDISNFLRLYVEEPAGDRSSPTRWTSPERWSSLERLCRSFQVTTGWQLRFYPSGSDEPTDDAWFMAVCGEPDLPAAWISLATPTGDSESRELQVSLERSSSLAAAVGELLAELQRARRTVKHREAELAAGIPLVAHEDEAGHLAERLESVLRGGARAIGCHAAALYLLDDATSELKLRTHWGLPADRFLDPPRPLRGAIADLEALTGHAVVLEDTSRMMNWQPPESFPAAACVPVASPTMLLGTLWMFSDHTRDFTSEETNLIEIISGRVAADLERQLLLHERIKVTRFEHELAELNDAWQNALPSVSPLVEGWEVAADINFVDFSAGDFYDWFALADGRLALSLGSPVGQSVHATLVGASMRATMQTHREVPHAAPGMLQQVNQALWRNSAGDHQAALFYALVDPSDGRLEFAGAGAVSPFILRPHGWEPIGREAAPLGSDSETTIALRQEVMSPGDLLLVIGQQPAASHHREPPSASAIAETLLLHTHLPARELVEMAVKLLDSRGSQAATVLVAKRDAEPANPGRS